MMAATIARFTLGAILTLTSASLEADVLVAFRSEATIGEGVVTLGDIADVRSADPADRQKLSSVIIGPAPAADRTTTLAFETIRSRLLSAGVPLADIQFSGPTTITLSGLASLSSKQVSPTLPSPASSSISRDRTRLAVEAAIRRYLVSRTGGNSYAVSATLNDDAIAAVVTGESGGFEVSGGLPPWTGIQTFTLRFIDRREQIQCVETTCDVAPRPSVLAAKHSLPRGHVLRADDLIWRKAESDSDAECLTDPQAALGMETQHPLRTGQAIPRSALKALPLVRNGQFVTVTSRRPGMSVQRVMKAKADGCEGEVIALLTLEDRKTVLARVTGLQEAEVVDSPDSASPTGSLAVIEEARGPILQTAFESPTAPLVESIRAEPRVHVNPTHILSVPKTN